MAKTQTERARTDRNPKTKPGVTGFVQDYNEEPGPQQDLNPDAVTEDSILPEPLEPADDSAPRTRTARRSTAVAPMSTERGGKPLAKPRKPRK
jgi:hypothetical protein